MSTLSSLKLLLRANEMPCMLGAVEKTLQFYSTFASFFSQSWFWKSRMRFEVFPGASVTESRAGIPASLGPAVMHAWVPGLPGFLICKTGYYHHLPYMVTSSKLKDKIKHLAHWRHSSKNRIFLSFLRPDVASPFFLLSFLVSQLIQNGFFGGGGGG